MKTRIKKYSTTLLLWFFATLITAGIWLMTFHQLSASKANYLNAAERDASSFATAFQEHSIRTIQAADQAVQFLKHEYIEVGTKLDILELFSSGVIVGDIFNLYSVMDGHGDIVLSSKPFSPGNYSDREHVRVHQEQDTQQLFISKPVLGRVSGKWSIQMTRRINDRHGKFNGVVVVSMDPFYFTRLYQSINVGKHGSVSLVGADGIVRARRTDDSTEIGQNVSSSPLLKRMLATSDGIYRVASTVDGRERVYAYRKLKNYPLFVLVGIDVNELLQPYESAKSEILAIATAATLVIFFFVSLLTGLIRRLVRSREQAILANAAKTQFLSNMSHELRTPLNGILGYSELLQEDLPPGELHSFAKYINESGTHLLALVNTLLNLGKIEAGEVDLSIKHENLANLLEQAIHGHVASAMGKQLSLQLEMAPNLPAEIDCDRLKVMQVLNNLLHNAIKFTPAGGVRLVVTFDGRRILFAVIDTGPGIPMQFQRAVFEKFFQVDATDARAKEGTGLGLAITKQLVILMGGVLRLESTPGKGSTFRFFLPLVPPSTVKAPHN